MRRNFKHANAQAFTQTDLYTEAFTQKFFTQMRQMLLHTEAFEHRCLYTKKHLPRDALTYTRLIHTEAFRHRLFSENHRSFDTEKPLHRESFTHRRFYTHKLFHRSFYTEKLLRTGAFTHRCLCTEACTHGGFYAQKLLHREAFTQTLSHRKTDSTEQLLHASKNRNLT